MECAVCCEKRSIANMQQILPCLHVFCVDCVRKWRESIKWRCIFEGKRRKRKFVVVCLAFECYSRIRKDGDDRLCLRLCDNPDCCARQSFYPLEKLPCQHQVCDVCSDDARTTNPPRCPVEGCGKLLYKKVGGLTCAVDCGKLLVDGAYVVTKCCGSKICNDCFETIYGRKAGKNEEVICSGICLGTRDDLFDEDPVWPASKCVAKPGCSMVPLSGFPSEFECEHDVCRNCVEEMLRECVERSNLPHCPKKDCEVPYAIETALALKELFPKYEPYFDILNLDNKGCPKCVDTESKLLNLTPGFKSRSRYMTIRAEQTLDSTCGLIEFDKKATVEDFFREVRRALDIGPDKVYGYYIRRMKTPGVSSDEEEKPDEELVVTPGFYQKTVSELGLPSDCTLIVDTRGCVRPKVFEGS